MFFSSDTFFICPRGFYFMERDEEILIFIGLVMLLLLAYAAYALFVDPGYMANL